MEKTTPSKRVCDEYAESFSSVSDLVNEVLSMEGNTEWWDDVTSSSIRVMPILREPEASELAEISASPEAVSNTVANTKLMLKCRGIVYPLRDTAIKSLLETAKINGSSIGRLPSEDLAKVLNLCLAVADGKSLILHRDDKVAAVLSDSKNGYKHLPMSQLILESVTELEERFSGKEKFEEAYLTHDYMTVIWTIDEPELLGDYHELVKDSVYATTLQPALRMSSSDVGTAAATIFPMFKLANGNCIRINGEMKIPHRKGHTVMDFKLKMKEIFSKFTEASEKFGELAGINLDYPSTAFQLACKKAGLPKKLACRALEEFQMYVGEDRSSAHDVYMGICEIIYYAKAAEYSNKDLCRLEDLVAKCLTFNWSELDLAGEHKW